MGRSGRTRRPRSRRDLKHIHDTQRNWDVLDLRWIDGEIDQGETERALHSAGFNCESRVWHSTAQIELDGGWEQYWASRKSTWRSNVRRCERLLTRQGSLEHIRYRPLGEAAGDGDPRWDLYDACVELARRSWQGESTTGTTLSHESVRDYLRAAHESAAKAGAVDLNLLLLERPAGRLRLQLPLARLGVRCSSWLRFIGRTRRRRQCADGQDDRRQLPPRRSPDRPRAKLSRLQTPLADPAEAGISLRVFQSRPVTAPGCG